MMTRMSDACLAAPQTRLSVPPDQAMALIRGRLEMADEPEILLTLVDGWVRIILGDIVVATLEFRIEAADGGSVLRWGRYWIGLHPLYQVTVLGLGMLICVGAPFAIYLSLEAMAWLDAAIMTIMAVGLVLEAVSQVRSRYGSRDADRARLVTRVQKMFASVLVADE